MYQSEAIYMYTNVCNCKSTADPQQLLIHSVQNFDVAFGQCVTVRTSVADCKSIVDVRTYLHATITITTHLVIVGL